MVNFFTRNQNKGIMKMSWRPRNIGKKLCETPCMVIEFFYPPILYSCNVYNMILNFRLWMFGLEFVFSLCSVLCWSMLWSTMLQGRLLLLCLCLGNPSLCIVYSSEKKIAKNRLYIFSHVMM